MNNTNVNPVNVNSPRNFINTNSLGSDFAAANSLSVSWGLNPEMDKAIIDVIPREFQAFPMYMQSAKASMSGKEINWFQGIYPNRPLVVKTNTAAAAPVVGGYATQTIPVEDYSIEALTIGAKVHYPDGTQGIMSAVNRTPGAATATISAMRSLGLSAVVATDIMPVHSQVGADGTWGYDASYTSDLQRYSNIIEMANESARFDRFERQALVNQQSVDFIGQRKRELMHRAMASASARLWLSNYGLGQVPGTSFFNNGTPYPATYTRGILQHMLVDGVQTQTTSVATAIDDVYQKAQDNSLLAGTQRWKLYGTADKLQALGQAERSQRVRYAPGETVANRVVTSYEFFNGLTITPIAEECWKDVSYYGNILRNDLILIPDGGEDTGVSLRYMAGIPMMEIINANNINDGMAQYSMTIIRQQWAAQVKKAFTYGRFTIL